MLPLTLTLAAYVIHSPLQSVPRSPRYVVQMQFGLGGPPPEILDKIQPGWRNDFVGSNKDLTANWRAFERVYGSREKALAASRKNSQVLLPIINTPQRITGAHASLIELFGKEEAGELVEKNPGVLACDPQSLLRTSKADIRNAANSVAAFDSLPATLKQALPFLTWLLIVGSVGTRLVQCGGAETACGADWDLQGGLGPQAVRWVQSVIGL